jgi:hypothetical protein
MLLLLYVVVFINSSSFAPHHHHAHDAHDADSCFSDPCHISIYHAGHKGGCSHPYHLTVAKDSCVWCQMAPFRQIAPEIDTLFLFNVYKPSTCSFFLKSTPRSVSIEHADRGPPSVS